MCKANTNPTFIWVTKQEGLGVIKIDADIKDHTKGLRGIYGFFINNTCIYVGRSQSIYGRIFDNDGYLAILRAMSIKFKETKEIKYQEKPIPNYLFDAIIAKEQISIKILERVPCQFDNYSKDMQRLASAEYKQIDCYQKKGQCLNQLPDGSNMPLGIWESKSFEAKINNI
ncbi:MAG: hypothetical protein ABS911_12205 [Carnobacterium sp.]|uniref:hypothetical protein n=1 Tax=Carnobacterium sp. TaxID=48221 RepID=UPI003315593B